jgi:hypothetical protein
VPEFDRAAELESIANRVASQIQEPGREKKMKSGYKAVGVVLFLTIIGGGLLLHARTVKAAEVPYTFVTVDAANHVKGAASTQVLGLNDRGDIVGSYNFIPQAGAFGLPAGFLGKAFVLKNDGTFTTIDGPGPVNPQLCQPPQSFQNCYIIEPHGINNQGDVVGSYSQDVLNPDGGLFRGWFQQAHGQFTSYLFPGHSNANFQGITETGTVYGCFHDEGIDNSSRESMHAFIGRLQSDGTLQNVSFDAEGTTMNVGGSEAAIGYAGVFYDFNTLRHRAYIFTGGQRLNFDMPGSNMTHAWAMNERGDVVGVWGNNPDPIIIDGIPFHGFVRDRGGNFIAIDFPGSIDTHVFGINASGDIVGSYVDSSFNIHGFVARPGDHAAIAGPAQPAMLNASFSGKTGAKDAAAHVVVAMMPVVPKDKPLLAPAQVSHHAHHMSMQIGSK